MRKVFSFWMVLGMVCCLTLPVHLMAANVNIQTADGVNTALAKPYKSFTIDINGNITILYDGTSADLPDPLQLQPVITISGTGVDNNTATVTGTITAPVTFSVGATDTDFKGTNDTLTLSYFYPGEATSPFTPSASSTGTFSKTYTTPGVYYVIFKASYDPDGLGTTPPFDTQRTIKIAIDQQQTCQSTVTLTATNPSGGTISNPSQTVACGNAVTFSGSFYSGYTGASATQGTFTPNGLYWSLTGITAPAANGGTNPVNITFTGSQTTTCTSFTYSAWSACANSSQTRTILSSLPAGCTGGSPVTTQSCGINPGGTYGAEVASAMSIDSEIYAGKGLWGYSSTEGGQDYSVPSGSTVYFLANPAVHGLSTVRITVADYDQGVRGGRHQAMLIPIDSNNNLVQIPATKKIFPYTMIGDNLFYTVSNLPATYRYLIMVTQNGMTRPLSIYYAR